jgi:hypothetical protein
MAREAGLLHSASRGYTADTAVAPEEHHRLTLQAIVALVLVFFGAALAGDAF